MAVEAGDSLVQAMARGRERALAARHTIDARPEE